MTLHAAPPSPTAGGCDEDAVTNTSGNTSFADVAEVRRDAAGAMALVRGSRFNRRITSATVVELAGPARRSPQRATRFSATGSQLEPDAASPRHYEDLKGGTVTQLGNPNGHIIRWRKSTASVTAMAWDIHLFGAQAATSPAAGACGRGRPSGGRTAHRASAAGPWRRSPSAME